ncbi:MAG: NADP-binding protein [Candidatus Riflebacteria bacterium]|nr:NADP-binding protein [Candidatus Riflebacteria bacterium]
MKPIRVVQWGLGALGRSLVRLMTEKEGLRIIGAIESRKGFAGKDLGKVAECGKNLQILVKDTHKGLLKKSDVDVVVHATTSFTREVIDEIQAIVEAGIHCITLTEEMAYPELSEPDIIKPIEALARKNRVTVLGAGFNPGFILDSQIIMMTACCHRVEKIEAERKINLLPLGESYFRTLGIGNTHLAFQVGLSQGTILKHIGFKESAYLISHATGLEIDSMTETVKPVLAETDRVIGKTSLKAGSVCAVSHSASASFQNKEIIRLSQLYYTDAADLKGDVADKIRIHGYPDINMSIDPEIPANMGAVGIVVNMIPLVVKSSPGIKRVFDMPIPGCLMGETAYSRRS